MNRFNTLRLKHTQRPGNVLVGCLVALGIFLVLIIAGAIYVAMTWRTYAADWTVGGITKALESSPIEETERTEIIAHIDTLMTRFKAKEVTLKQLGNVVETLTTSPLMTAALVMGADEYYITRSDLSDEEKAQGRIDIARFSYGIFNESIHPSIIQDVLEPIATSTPDDNDIVLNMQFDSKGRTTNALRSADEVSSDDLRLLIANAKEQADIVGVTQTPQPIDLSNEMAIAIANALEEDPMEWLPAGTVLPEPGSETQPSENTDIPDPDDEP